MGARSPAEARPKLALTALLAEVMIRMDGAFHGITAQLNVRSVVRADQAPGTDARQRSDPGRPVESAAGPVARLLDLEHDARYEAGPPAADGGTPARSSDPLW